MTARDYAAALARARDEYHKLLAEREELDVRIARLQQGIAALSAICGEATEHDAPGLTEACRMALKAADEPLRATALRDRIAALGVDLSGYSNALASIHVVLRRLVAAGEVSLVPRSTGAPRFAWRPPLRSVLISKTQADALRRGDQKLWKRLEKRK